MHTNLLCDVSPDPATAGSGGVMIDALTHSTDAADLALVRALEHSASRHMAVAYRVLRHEQDARDVLQEAWLRAWRARHRLRDHDALEAWLRRIVVRECYRKLQWRRTRSWLSFGMVPERPDPAPHLDETLDLAARHRRFVAAAQDLSPRQALVFSLRFQQGWTVAEIAASADMRPDTVKTHLKRAVARVRARLEDP